ncbi:unnamed protein product, partial [Meganyctiphanes norvegica]
MGRAKPEKYYSTVGLPVRITRHLSEHEVKHGKAISLTYANHQITGGVHLGTTILIFQASRIIAVNFGKYNIFCKTCTVRLSTIDSEPRLYCVTCTVRLSTIDSVLTKANNFSYNMKRTTDEPLLFNMTAIGYKSWRHKEQGSVFIQYLVNVLRRHAYNDDLASLMTKVNRYMTKNFEPTAGFKQGSTVVSTLTRKVVFSNSK